MAEKNDKKTYEITAYQYAIYSGKKSRIPRAIIELVSKKSRLGRLRFSDDYSLAKATQNAEGQFELQFSYDDFANMVDMLRNEGPCYLVWRGPNDTYISTGAELVGEGES